MKFRKTYILFLVLLAVVYSCAPAKQKIRDVNKALPENYKEVPKDTVSSATIKWEDFFAEPKLNKLIDTALVNNQELNIMYQRVAISKNEIKARKGEYLPFVNFQAGSEIGKVGEYTRRGTVERNLKIKEGSEFPEPLANHFVGLSASWELDIWKKLRNSKKIAAMEYLSTLEGKNFLVTNLVTEIANSYYELVALDNRLEIINQNLELQQNALEFIKILKKSAKVTELAVKRFQAEVLKNRSGIYEIKQRIVELENRINFLLGRKPTHVDRDSSNFLQNPIAEVSQGIPASLLANRPDIRQAEYELVAAKLNVKVARANFYPSIGIRADLGLEAFQPKFLVDTPKSLFYNLAGDLVAPLINRNALKATYRSANKKQIEAIYEYEKAILNGYIEVVNQLSNIDNLKENYKYKDQQVTNLNESIIISNKLFQSARADYMEVLLTQRDALEAKIDLVETKKKQLVAKINFYRALGGGWK